MTTKTLLQICTEVVDGVKDVNTPSTIIGNTAPEAVLLKRMATKVGRELERGWNWQALKREHDFTTFGGADYDLPSDFRRFVPLTGWDRTGSRPLVAANSIGYQALKSSIIVSGITYYFEVSAGQLHFEPVPASGLDFAINYYSSQFIDTSASVTTGLDDWTADTNVCRLDGDLMVLGVTYRYLARQGAPYAEEKADYLQAIKDLQYDDTPATLIDTGPSAPMLPIGQISDGNWDLSL
jgi:hypothetical protein